MYICMRSRYRPEHGFALGAAILHSRRQPPSAPSYVYMHIYIYIYIERERERLIAKGGAVETGCSDLYGVMHDLTV